MLKRILYGIAGVVVLLVVAAGALYATGSLWVLILPWAPRGGWDVSRQAAAPDYADPKNWAALPSQPGLSSDVPAGVQPAAANPQVDVFFIHPTGYMHGAEWNSPMDPASETEENTKWMMANQVSVFNGCCAIYAPRYREGSIFRYIHAGPDLFKKSGDLAYGDVDRAFTWFLEHYSKGRPFIIASHSQGTEHGFNLVARRIDGTPLAARMVAAYLIGGGITDKEMAGLKTIHACASATDLHCIIHWATYGEGTKPVRDDVKGKLLCVNPLTWQRDGGMAPASMSLGAVPPSGSFQIRFWGADKATGMPFPPLGAPLPHWTGAECRNGFLFASDQSKTPFGKFGIAGNYHGLDYPLWAMDIRESAKARVAAYLKGNAQP